MSEKNKTHRKRLSDRRAAIINKDIFNEKNIAVLNQINDNAVKIENDIDNRIRSSLIKAASFSGAGIFFSIIAGIINFFTNGTGALIAASLVALSGLGLAATGLSTLFNYVARKNDVDKQTINNVQEAILFQKTTIGAEKDKKQDMRLQIIEERLKNIDLFGGKKQAIARG